MGLHPPQPAYAPLVPEAVESADSSAESVVTASHLRAPQDRHWLYAIVCNVTLVLVLGAAAASKQSSQYGAALAVSILPLRRRQPLLSLRSCAGRHCERRV